MSQSPISTPKGGGAISGLGEKFSPDLFTGTGNFSVPFALPPGRNGFQPELGLQYSTGSGNSPFGLGWNLSVPGVMRKTAKGVPKYDETKDTFILSGAEDLVAVKKMNIRYVQNGTNDFNNNDAGIAPLNAETGIITQYRPRTEGLFARIYYLQSNLRNCWKVMSKNGLTSWYGSNEDFESDKSLVSDPENSNKIFAWKLTRTEDTFGNHILYIYEHDAVNENDYHHWDQNYLKEIKYADYSLTPFGGTGTAYMVRVELVYEERKDAFSDFKAGFEIRTTQRCKEINIYTNPNEGEIKTRTYHFQYSDEDGILPEDERPYNGVSLLCKVEVKGHDEANNANEFLPPLEFRYTHFKPKQQKFKRLDGNQLPLASLANPGFELIDLFGNGLPDIVEINGLVRYWRNLGDGKFDIPRVMKDAPSGFNLGDPDVQLIDANGDGRTDLMVNGTNMAGYFSTKYGASWDAKAFKKYKQAPSFNLADPEVKMMDLTGDGITDALRNGASFECFFHDKNDGWTETRRIPKKQITKFPNVSFADPRIKMVDMTADGLQDIVYVHSGNVTYWPNLGYGNFAKPVVMKNSPRFQYPFDPARIQLADIDGDGLADLIYIDVNKITFWINQSGNSWSEPFEISGTPFVTNIKGIRIIDILGNGTSGVLYSFDAMTSTQQHRWFFLDLTGGVKPYLLHEMDNNMGALTRVSYLSSTRYYLADQYGMNPLDPNSERKFNKRKPWKTTLPFPVQTVSRVEVIDQLSKGKLATEYIYHHGYWDGGEREFRGFGRVDQRDTETFERYITPSVVPEHGVINQSFNSSFVSNNGEELQFNTVAEEHYSPPIETRNWFHLGPVGDEFGDWMEVDFREEYWQGIRDKGLADGTVLPPDIDSFRLLQSLPRRAKRDAFRAWRGSSLRSELYALDEYDSEAKTYKPGADGIPYTVSESSYGLRLEAQPLGSLPPLGGQGVALSSEVLIIPKETSGYVFFSFATASRTSQWERGIEPMTQLSFTTDYDEFGQPRKQLSVALSRGMVFTWDTDGTIIAPSSTNILAEDGGGPMLSTASVTAYAKSNFEETGVYIVDRSCKAISYEIIQQTENVFELKTRVFSAVLPTEVENTIYPIIGFSINYYADETPFSAGLLLGDAGKHGALARSETLVLTDAIINDAYDANTPECFKSSPDWSTSNGYHDDFAAALQHNDPHLGYKRYTHTDDPDYATGWYAESGRTKYDWQDSLIPDPKGLVLETKDIFESRASIEYDNYLLLPVTAKQWLDATTYLSTTAAYDYRVMQAKMITDPNGNRAIFDFSPLGLLKQSGVIGKNTVGTGNPTEGDLVSETSGEINYVPSVRMEYDFFAFNPLPNTTPPKNPVWVKTIQREKHWQDDPTDDSPTIIKAEYTDGFGRLLQTRTQAEDVIFGDSIFGDSGLPEIQGQNGDAIGIERGVDDDLNVVVSGWKIYNNKGKVVEQYEPYFDIGFDYLPPFDLSALLPGIQSGEKIRLYYDPRGNVIRTVNPDNTEQWVIHGKPNSLDSVAINNSWSFKNYAPTPWESYTYDTNDLAGKTGFQATGHEDTPKNAVVDALGRTVKTIDRLSRSSADDIVMRYTYDIQGNNLSVLDAYIRPVFVHKYDLNKKVLWTKHIDGGEKTILTDVQGKLIEGNDDKGARTLAVYDAIGRGKAAYAKDNSDQTDFTLRGFTVYSDEPAGGLTVAEAKDRNIYGKAYKTYDESGLIIAEQTDFKGNLLIKQRYVIDDATILSTFPIGGPYTDLAPYITDWVDMGSPANILEADAYETGSEYDALNRVVKITYPKDVNNDDGKIAELAYNRAGALEKATFDGTEYVNHIAYNAKGQQLLVVWNNGVMTRYAYNKKTFRVSRLRTEQYTTSTPYTYETNSGVKQDYSYTYDLVGNIVGINENVTDCGLPILPNELKRIFEYDSLYRLTRATGREINLQPSSNPWQDVDPFTPNPPSNPTAENCRSYNQQYEYDKAGNITELSHAATSNNWTRVFNYNSGNNKLNEIRDGGSVLLSDFTYDENGNKIQSASNRFYQWNHSDKLVLFYDQPSSGAEPTVYAQYIYDATGNRIKKVTRTAAGAITESVTYIDGAFECHKRGTEKKNYTKFTGGIEIRTGGYTLEDTSDDILTYTLTDHLSSSTTRLNGSATVIDWQEYYPYGETSLRTYGKKRYRYCGKERDEESGLYYYGARYYAPWTCKFLSIDPMAGKYAHQSGYCYANSNPILFNDPTGMEGEPSGGGGGATSGGGGSGGGSSGGNSGENGSSSGGGSESGGSSGSGQGGAQTGHRDANGIYTFPDVVITAPKPDKPTNNASPSTVIPGEKKEPEHKSAPELIKATLGLQQEGVKKITEKVVEPKVKDIVKNVSKGKLMATNGKTYQSPRLTKAGKWKNVGFPGGTTKGLEAVEAFKGASKVVKIGSKLTSILEIPGLFEGAEYVSTHEPLVLIPGMSGPAEQMRKFYNAVDDANFQTSVLQGYKDIKLYLDVAKLSHRQNDLAIQGVQLITVSEGLLLKLVNNEVQNEKQLNSLIDTDLGLKNEKNCAILIKFLGNNQMVFLAGYTNIKK